MDPLLLEKKMQPMIHSLGFTPYHHQEHLQQTSHRSFHKIRNGGCSSKFSSSSECCTTLSSALGKRSICQQQQMTHSPSYFSSLEDGDEMMQYNTHSDDEESRDDSDDSLDLFEMRSSKKVKQVHTVSIKVYNSTSSNSITCSFPFYSVSSNCHNLISNSTFQPFCKNI